ncbi:MAG: uroporphyrinogen-III synthase [Thaumarchaeota archaeon]|nr:uroporphyrinogen-III synthase [Nitrososphaerota archaeon]
MKGKMVKEMLEGRTVVITRPKHQADDLAQIVTKLGGKPRIVPTVEIGPVSNLEEVREPLQLIVSGGADLIVFMSQNGVTSFVALAERLGVKEKMLKALSKMQVVAIGSKTKARLEKQSIRVDITPEDFSSDGLADTLLQINLDGKVIVLPRTDKPTDYLNVKLAERQVKVVQFPVYETRIPSDVVEVLHLIRDILLGDVDIITFTSSATAQNLMHIADTYRAADRLRKALNEKTLVASIGPVTEKTLRSLGVEVHVTPSEYTIDAMMNAVDAYFMKEEGKITLDDVDTKILDVVQKAVPLTTRPWDEIGRTLGLSGVEVLRRLKRLSDAGMIRKIGPIIDARKVGLTASTLVGVRVPPEQIEEIASIINQYDEVSHNYERNHEYNLWFTLTAPSQDELSRILKEIQAKTGVSDEDVLNLRTERLFKIKVNFDLKEKKH